MRAVSRCPELVRAAVVSARVGAHTGAPSPRDAAGIIRTVRAGTVVVRHSGHFSLLPDAEKKPRPHAAHRALSASSSSPAFAVPYSRPRIGSSDESAGVLPLQQWVTVSEPVRVTSAAGSLAMI